MPDCNTPEENALVERARQMLARYEDMADMIRLGAYRPGSDPGIDEAIAYYPQLEAFLSQGRHERGELASGYAALAALLSNTPSLPAVPEQNLEAAPPPELGSDAA
jgi:flagellum-specific ATP synthase